MSKDTTPENISNNFHKPYMHRKSYECNEHDKPIIRTDLFQALIDNAEHSITIAEREGNDTILLYVNKAFEEMTGYTSEECLYKDCRFLQANDKQKSPINKSSNKQSSNKKIRKAIDDSKPVSVVIRNYKKDGTLFWNELTITPYYDNVDNVMYFIGVQKYLGSNDNLLLSII